MNKNKNLQKKIARKMHRQLRRLLLWLYIKDIFRKFKKGQ